MDLPAPERETSSLPAKREGFTLKVLFVHYFVFGFAYNIYATYFVAFMVDEVHLSGKLAGLIWSLFGWTCLASGLVWGALSDRLGRKTALLWNNLLISLAVLLPLLFRQPILLGTSTFLFGFTFLGTITIVAASVGDLSVEKKASVYGLITLVHGIGQFLGTTSGGYLKDLTGSFHATLLCSLVGFVLCCVVILSKRKEVKSISSPLS
jgi:predicted MFS family arabinose efflux permease